MSDHKRSRTIQANLIAGVLTTIPILVVWVILNFIFSILFSVGAPVEQALMGSITRVVPGAAPVLNNEVFQWFVAVVVALLLIYTIGAAARRVIGMRFIAFLETFIARIPFVETIYSASKKLVGVLQQQPGGTARVVLIEFPNPGMKAVGLVMRTFIDAGSGEEVAAVYVPTTPNPTSGYLELVPVRNLVATDMTMDQAMTMIVSGGAIAPDRIDMGTRRLPTS